MEGGGEMEWALLAIFWGLAEKLVMHARFLFVVLEHHLFYSMFGT